MMDRIRRSRLTRRLLQATLACAVVAGVATQLAQPALADHNRSDDWWRYQQNHQRWDRHDRDWRHEGHWDHGRYYRPYYYGPRAYYYPNPQPYEPAPSFSFGFSVPVH